MRKVAAVLLFVVGCFVGLRFADFDLPFRWYPLIEHRSLLTHGVLIPLLLFVSLRPHLLNKNADPRLRLFIMGFCLASAVHLCFDLFPRGMIGYSRVHIPLWGWSGWPFSALWLLGSALVCLYLAFRLLRGLGDLGLVLLGLVTCYGISAAAEPRPSFFALFTLVPVAFAAFLLPRQPHDPDSPSSEISRWMRF